MGETEKTYADGYDDGWAKGWHEGYDRGERDGRFRGRRDGEADGIGKERARCTALVVREVEIEARGKDWWPHYILNLLKLYIRDGWPEGHVFAECAKRYAGAPPNQKKEEPMTEQGEGVESYERGLADGVKQERARCLKLVEEARQDDAEWRDLIAWIASGSEPDGE